MKFDRHRMAKAPSSTLPIEREIRSTRRTLEDKRKKNCSHNIKKRDPPQENFDFVAAISRIPQRSHAFHVKEQSNKIKARARGSSSQLERVSNVHIERYLTSPSVTDEDELKARVINGLLIRQCLQTVAAAIREKKAKPQIAYRLPKEQIYRGSRWKPDHQITSEEEQRRRAIQRWKRAYM